MISLPISMSAADGDPICTCRSTRLSSPRCCQLGTLRRSQKCASHRKHGALCFLSSGTGQRCTIDTLQIAYCHRPCASAPV